MNVLLFAVALLVGQISPLVAILWPPRCYRKLDFGTCDAVKLKWFYEPISRQCKMFAYSGCGGNWNRFRTEKGCLRTCKMTSEPELSCSAKPNPGNCKAYRPMWYFDPELGYCRGFVYGGCGGNRNTYPNCRACMNRCTNFNPYLMCQYLEFEFFKKFIAGKLIVAPPPVTTGTQFSPVRPETTVAQPSPVATGTPLQPGAQPTPGNGYGPVWRAAVPSGVRSALRVQDTLVKSSG
uniref:Tissue factor pathway inhibitor n=1 Tax=Rhipicephalus zambeziensis TaxID=60191 RepID=A0A224YRE1_9ACAR